MQRVIGAGGDWESSATAAVVVTRCAREPLEEAVTCAKQTLEEAAKDIHRREATAKDVCFPEKREEAAKSQPV